MVKASERIPVKLLILEDREEDAELMLHELERSGFAPQAKRVEEPREFLEALSDPPDLILADYNLPQWSALEALRLLKEKGLDIPFILVTGSIGEEAAAACIREGIADYLLKDRLARLGTAVLQALEARRLRTEKERSEQALRESEERFRLTFHHAPLGMAQLDGEGYPVQINRALERLLGYSREEMRSRPFFSFMEEQDRLRFQEQLPRLFSGEVSELEGEVQYRDKEGRVHWVVQHVGLISGKGNTPPYLLVQLLDITERKEAEEKLQRQVQRLVALRTIDMAITASLDLRVTLGVILDQVTSLLEVDAADILLMDPNSMILQFSAGRGFRTQALQHTFLHLGQGMAGKVAATRERIYIPSLKEGSTLKESSPLLEKEGFVSYCAEPLIAKGKVNGVIELFHRSLKIPDKDWFEFLEALAAQAAIAIDNATLFHDLELSHAELIQAYEQTIEGWARALDLRDKETEGHTQRVTELTVRLARELGLSGEALVHIRRGALLHDMGKMGIPDAILLKPGPLNEEEWEIMRQHPVLAYRMLSPIEYLRPALEIPYYHHERWDGTGYPNRLKGKEIPLAARIFAVVDVWDALTNDRPYRKAWSKEKALAEIVAQAGKQFDPEVVQAFVRLLRGLGIVEDPGPPP